MAVKSILDIEVNDEQFKRFKQLYDQYQSTLQKMPKQWGQVGKETDKIGSHFEAMTSALMAQNQLLKEVYSTGDKTSKTLTHHASLWTRIQRSTTGVLKDVAGIARWLTRTGVKLGLAGFGLGVGGLLGLRGIAESVSNQRNFALSTGTQIGQEQAFKLHQGRYFANSDQLLQSAFAAQTAGTAQNVLAHILGVSTAGGSFQVADRMLLAVQALAKRTPANLVAQLPNMYPQLAAAGFNLGNIETLRNLSRQELETQIRGGERAAGALKLTQAQGRGYQDFLSGIETTFGTVSKQIERNLVHILGPVQNLVRVIGKEIVAFLQSKTAATAINDFAKAIESLGQYLASKDFSKAVDNLKSIGGDFGKAKTVAKNFFAPETYAFSHVGNWLGEGAGWLSFNFGEALDKARKNTAAAAHGSMPSHHTVHVHSTVTVKNQTGSNIHASVNALHGGT